MFPLVPLFSTMPPLAVMTAPTLMLRLSSMYTFQPSHGAPASTIDRSLERSLLRARMPLFPHMPPLSTRTRLSSLYLTTLAHRRPAAALAPAHTYPTDRLVLSPHLVPLMLLLLMLQLRQVLPLLITQQQPAVISIILMPLQQPDRGLPPILLADLFMPHRLCLLSHQLVPLLEIIGPKMEKVRVANDLLRQTDSPLRYLGGQNALPTPSTTAGSTPVPCR
jgi:hypothetical protein